MKTPKKQTPTGTATPTPPTPTPPQGMTICDNLHDFMQIAAMYENNPRLIAAVKRFFEFTAKMAGDTNPAARRATLERLSREDSANVPPMSENDFKMFLEYTHPADGDAAAVPAPPSPVPADGDAATGEDSAPVPPVLMDKKTQIMTDYLTGLFNPLASGRYAKAGEIAKKEGLTRGLRTFASLNRQEIELLNYIIGRARENLKIQADRLRQGLPPLSQGASVTYAEVIRAYKYGKYADVNAKFAAAFDLLAREKFLFFDEVRGEIRPISILDGVFNLKTKVKTYVISQQFLNTLPAIDACLLYYNIKQLTNGKMNVGDLSQYRGDKGILLVCIQLLFEMPYYDKKPFVYSSIAERARVKGVELKKNKDWKRAIKQAFNYLGYGVIDGDSDTARAMSENPNFTPNGDIFIIRPIEEVTAAEN